MSEQITNLLFKVFTTSEDHSDWDKHILYAELSEDTEGNKRQRWISALFFLKAEFGEDFLRINNHHHPVYRMVTEKAPWRTTEVTEFASTLQRLKESDVNYPFLLEKLMLADSCKAEGFPFVEISGTFLQTGCSVQVWREIKSQKNPDLAISFPDTNETLYIEVSKVNESKVRSDLDSNYKVISWLFNMTPPQLPFSCQLFRYISDREMPDVLATITSYREQALAERNIVHHNDEIMRLCVTHPDKFEEFEEWVGKHDYRKGLHGPPLNFDETSRILKYKIGQEMEQIPVGSTGMIYLPVHALYLGVTDPERIATEFEKKMAVHPLLFGIVLYSTIITECNPGEVTVNGHYFSVRKINEMVVRFFSFFKNPAYSGGLSESAVSKIYQSFR